MKKSRKPVTCLKRAAQAAVKSNNRNRKIYTVVTAARRLKSGVTKQTSNAGFAAR